MKIQHITFCTALLLSVCSITHAAPLEKGRIVYQAITFIEDENNVEKFVTFRLLGEAGEIMDEIVKMLPRIPNEKQTLYTAADKNNDHVIDEPEARYFHYASLLEQITSQQSRRVFMSNYYEGEKNYRTGIIFLLADDVAKKVMDDVERIHNMNFVDPGVEESPSISAREAALFRLYITADENNDNVINGSDALVLREWLIAEYQKKIGEKQ
jgi:hypothetical protein